MIKTRLTDTGTGKNLHTYPDPSGHPTLVITDYGRLHGTFASAVIGSATTTTIVDSAGDKGVSLTDLIISVGRTNGTEVTVQFTDSTPNTVVIAKVVTDNGATVAIPFQGNWGGWKASQIDVITNNAADVSVAVGYYRTPEENTLAFPEWDARR